MASATSKLATVLFLALIVAAAAGRQPGSGTCQLEAEAKDCAKQIIDYHKTTKKVFTPACCNQLASGPLGCGCLVRKLVLAALPGVDLQKPFCVDGSACTKY